jgi:hypothetical protein
MTGAAIHGELAAGRWATLTLAQQLGNVGGEVDRALRRAREIFCAVFHDENADPHDGEFLSKYLLQFAVAARR